MGNQNRKLKGSTAANVEVDSSEVGLMVTVTRGKVTVTRGR